MIIHVQKIELGENVSATFVGFFLQVSRVYNI